MKRLTLWLSLLMLMAVTLAGCQPVAPAPTGGDTATTSEGPRPAA